MPTQPTPATDSAAELHKLIGDDVTATFESEPTFIDSNPTSSASSENLEEQRPGAGQEFQAAAKTTSRGAGPDADEEDEFADEEEDEDDLDDDDDEEEDLEDEDDEELEDDDEDDYEDEDDEDVDDEEEDEDDEDYEDEDDADEVEASASSSSSSTLWFDGLTRL